MNEFPDHMSLVTSRSREHDGVHETYKYVVAERTREDAVHLAVPSERLSCKSCLKVSQLLACTIPTLPGLVLVGVSLCLRLLLADDHSSTDNVVGVFPRVRCSRGVPLQRLD